MFTITFIGLISNLIFRIEKEATKEESGKVKYKAMRLSSLP